MDGDKFKTAQTGYQSVIAVPPDLYLSGSGSKAVNKRTLWSASMPQSFDMNAFARGDYVLSLIHILATPICTQPGPMDSLRP